MHVCGRCCFGAALTRSPSGLSLNILSIDDRNVNGDVLAGGSADLTNPSSESNGLAKRSLGGQFIQKTVDDVGGKRIAGAYGINEFVNRRYCFPACVVVSVKQPSPFAASGYPQLIQIVLSFECNRSCFDGVVICGGRYSSHHLQFVFVKFQNRNAVENFRKPLKVKPWLAKIQVDKNRSLNV